MAGTDNLDFSALGQAPDFMSQYANAFKAGRQLVRPSFSMGGGEIAPSGAVGFDDANRVGQGAGSTLLPGPPLSRSPNPVATLEAHLAAVPNERRGEVLQEAQLRNEQLIHVLIGLKAYPQQNRLNIACHAASSSGLLDPSLIGPTDVTDSGIDYHLTQAYSIGHLIDEKLAESDVVSSINAQIHQYNHHTGRVE
jgi:hypothetical protein